MIVRIDPPPPPPPPHFFKRGHVNFDYLPRRGKSEKFKKGGGSMVQGQVFLKIGGGGGGGGGGDTFPI